MNSLALFFLAVYVDELLFGWLAFEEVSIILSIIGHIVPFEQP